MLRAKYRSVLFRLLIVMTLAACGQESQPPEPTRQPPVATAVPTTCPTATADILALTVVLRVEIDGLDSVGLGHGTLVNGRYIITHGHIEGLKPGLGNTGRIAIARTDGTAILAPTPLDRLNIAVFGPETWLIDLGVDLSTVMALSSLPLDQIGADGIFRGQTVTQVTFDGQTTRVDCVRVRAVRFEEGIAVLKLDSRLLPGASGGGVFLNGRLVGINWKDVTIYKDGTIDDAFSLAALVTTGHVNALTTMTGH